MQHKENCFSKKLQNPKECLCNKINLPIKATIKSLKDLPSTVVVTSISSFVQKTKDICLSKYARSIKRIKTHLDSVKCTNKERRSVTTDPKLVTCEHCLKFGKINNAGMLSAI